MGTLYAIAEIHSAEVGEYKKLNEIIKSFPEDFVSSSLKEQSKRTEQYSLLWDSLHLGKTLSEKTGESKKIVERIKPNIFFCEGCGDFDTNVSFFDEIDYKGRKIFLDDERRIGDISQTYEEVANRFIDDLTTEKLGKEEAKMHIYNLKHYANKIYNENLEREWASKISENFKEPSIIKCGRRHLIAQSNKNTVLLDILKQNEITVEVVMDEFHFLNADAKKFYEYLLSLE